MSLALLPLAVPPLTPDGDEARRWAEQELADPAYDAAQPNVVDRIAQGIGDFLGGLFGDGVDGAWGSWLALIAGLIVVALILAAFLIWGRPRSPARGRPAVAELFGETETRSAAELREAAYAHAQRGEWNPAIVLRFRAIARGLAERDIVTTSPGTTVHAFARSAARAFPGSAPRLDAAATAFDDVRYLRRPGTPEAYAAVREVDDELRAVAPAPRPEPVR